MPDNLSGTLHGKVLYAARGRKGADSCQLLRGLCNDRSLKAPLPATNNLFEQFSGGEFDVVAAVHPGVSAAGSVERVLEAVLVEVFVEAA